MNMLRRSNWIPASLVVLGALTLCFSAWGLMNSWQHTLSLATVASKSPATTLVTEAPAPVFEQMTTLGGRRPHFDLDGRSLYYVTLSGQLGFIGSPNAAGADTVVMELPLLARLAWDAGGRRAIVEWQMGRAGGTALDLVDSRKLTRTTLFNRAWGGVWTPDSSHITFIHAKDGIVGLWQTRPSGKGATQLADLTNIVAPEYVAWSAWGNRLLVQAAAGAAVFTMVDNTAIQINWIPWAKQAAWAPSGWSISYRLSGAETDTLWIADLDGKDAQYLWEGVFSEVRWLPDGRLVYFTPGKEGGAACWAQDPRTGTRELLADASVVVWKPVDTFAVSPRGDALAFEAQDRQIWVLRLPTIDVRD